MANGKGICPSCGEAYHGLLPCSFPQFLDTLVPNEVPSPNTVPVPAMKVPVASERERLHSLMTNVGKLGICKGCAQPIRWITHRNGKETPYDAEGKETVGVNHWITCPRREMLKRG